MKNKIIGLLVVVSLLSLPCYAGEGEQAFKFGRAFINSLQHLKTFEEMRIESLNSEDSSESEFSAAARKNLQLQIQEIQKAKSQILPYKDSNNERIKAAADYIIKSYQKLEEGMSEFFKLQEKFYSTPPEEINEGEYLAKFKTLHAAQEMAINLLVPTSVQVAQCLVSEQPDEEGSLSYLVITEEQRKELMLKWNSIFSKSSKNGIQPVRSHSEACAEVLRTVLFGGHKSSDERE